MEPITTFTLYSLLLLAVSMAGAFLPRARKLSDKQAHLLISLSAGIFLGLLFFLLLPEAIEGGIVLEPHGDHVHAHFEMVTVYALAAGFLLIMTIETYMKHRHMGGCACECCKDSHSHRLMSMSSFIGLSVHAACDGLALAATFLAGEEVGLIATVGMCIHKFVVLFSLSTTMILSDETRKQAMTRLFAFSLITPVAGLAFFLALNGIDLDSYTGIPLAFAAGTFMYVAMCNMLPEAFHRKKQNVTSFALVVVGMALILIFTVLFPHTH